MSNTIKMSFIAELDILKTVDHPNIIKLYDLFLYDGNYYVVTEFC
jgi:serine/threonine protein kinase